MKASFKPAHKRDARRFATFNIPHYEAFEACVEGLVTGEGMVAIRFKPRPWAPLVRFGLKLRPVLIQNKCAVRLDRPDYFQVFAMRIIRDGTVVPAQAIATPLLIHAEHFPAVRDEPDFRLGCIMYAANKALSAKYKE